MGLSSVINSWLLRVEDAILANKPYLIAGVLLFTFFLVAIGIIGAKESELPENERIARGGYETPYEYEKYVASRLVAAGYQNVFVTRGSCDFGADIICDYCSVRYAVQVKMYTGSVGYRAVEEAVAGMHYYGCSRAMVITTGTFTKQAIIGAEQMGVILLDRFC